MNKKLVKIDWNDAESDPDWTELYKILEWGRKPCECTSYGLLIDKNKVNVVIASTKNGGDYSDLKKIPVKMVSKITYINGYRGKKKANT